MGAVAARAKFHQPDPELADLLVSPNGFASKLASSRSSIGIGQARPGSPDTVRSMAGGLGPQVGRPVACGLVDDGRSANAVLRAMGGVSVWVATHKASAGSWALAVVCGLLWLLGVSE